MKMSETESTTIRIPIELRETLKELAEYEGLSMVDLIRKMTLTEILFATTDKALFDKMPTHTQIALASKLAELEAWNKRMREQ